jgi:hypothetical protein
VLFILNQDNNGLNAFALMRQLLPLEFANKRAKYIRYRLYAIAAKVIKTGRKVQW